MSGVSLDVGLERAIVGSCAVEAWRPVKLACLLCPFLQSGTSAHRVGLPCSAIPFWKSLHRHTQSRVSKVSLNSVKLMDKMNRYTISPPWIPTHLCFLDWDRASGSPQLASSLRMTWIPYPPASTSQSAGITGMCYHAQIPQISYLFLKFVPLAPVPSVEKDFSDKLMLILHEPISSSRTNILSPVNFFPNSWDSVVNVPDKLSPQ